LMMTHREEVDQDAVVAVQVGRADPGALQDTRTWPASRRTRDERVPGAIASYGVATTRAAKERAATMVEENIFETWCVERGE
jgi:hypothetical protein